MKTVCLIGAGNIGSRHLQGLKRIDFPLSIEVVDPSKKSLEIAKQRASEIPKEHSVTFLTDIKDVSQKLDLAIIATNSSVRRKVLEVLLSHASVPYLILEKILFQKKEDYSSVGKLLKDKGSKAWVNFSMRTMPSYSSIKQKVKKPIQMVVSGSQYGLITNVIHFIDYISFLTECREFTINSTNINPRPFKSKRAGFLELNGTLSVHFKDGSSGIFTCYDSGSAPFVIEIFSQNFRYISRESEKKAWLSSPETNWSWHEISSKIPYQSEMTDKIAKEIFNSGTCELSKYEDASKLHLELLEQLQGSIKSLKKYGRYPFT